MLHYAVMSSWPHVLEVPLKRRDGDFKALNGEHKSALLIASECGFGRAVNGLSDTDVWMVAGCRDKKGIGVFDSLLPHLELESAMCKLLHRYTFAPRALISTSSSRAAFLPQIIENGWHRVLDIALALDGISVNAVGKHGLNATHVAAIESDERAVRKLIAAGADCSLRDDQGRTTLHYGLQSDLISIPRLLIARTDIHVWITTAWPLPTWQRQTILYKLWRCWQQLEPTWRPSIKGECRPSTTLPVVATPMFSDGSSIEQARL